MITIYPADCRDFSTNGLGLLTPLACTVTEQAQGRWELALEQPIDGTNRWALLAAGRILKVPVPARESPVMEAEAAQESPAAREVYRVKVRSHLRLRQGPGTDTGILGAYGSGTRVIALDREGDWVKVCLCRGGAVGWMHGAYLEPTGVSIFR